MIQSKNELKYKTVMVAEGKSISSNIQAFFNETLPFRIIDNADTR